MPVADFLTNTAPVSGAATMNFGAPMAQPVGPAPTTSLPQGQIPAGSAVTNMTNQTLLPSWYTGAAMQTLANQQAVANNPYATYQGPRLADFTGAQRDAFGMTQGAAGAYQPGLGQAQAVTTSAMQQPGGLDAAMPWLTQAGGSGAPGITDYMNPYTQQVVSRIAELGGRNLSENIMPSIENKFIGAGQLGFGGRGGANIAPSGMMTDTARAVRDVSNDVLAQQSAAMQTGWNNAAGLSQSDQSRRLGVGQAIGSLAGQQTSQQLAGGAQMAQLAGLAQQYGLTGADAVGGVGRQQQQLNQQNLDIGYQDFLRQQGYPQAQIDAMMNTLRGMSSMVPTATNQSGISPSGVPASYAPSTASTIAGSLLGLAGVLGK